MAATFQLPANQIVDQNGNPRAGAKLEFYSAGTSTPRNVFSNDALSIILPQPVVADASGRFPPIFMTPVLYRVILKTSTDVVLNDWDNVDPGLPVGSGALPIANGGTGATTATAARSNLGIINDQPFVDVATASTMPIFAANSDHVNATGTTTVNAFDSAASGRDVLVRSVSSFTLTHSANLICPNAQSIVTRPDDTFRVVSQGAGISRVVMVGRASPVTVLGNESTPTAVTAIDFAIPANVSEVLVSLRALSLSGTDEFVFRLGNGGGVIVTTGYQSVRSVFDTVPTTPAAAFASSGLVLGDGAMLAASTYTGQIECRRQSASNNTWIMRGFLMNSANTRYVLAQSFISLASPLDSCRLASTVSNTFDAGGISVSWRF